jgi:hypothetical protein
VSVKPSIIPVWSTSGVNNVAPTSLHKTSGYVTNEIPTAQELNGQLFQIGQWLQYVSDGDVSVHNLSVSGTSEFSGAALFDVDVHVVGALAVDSPMSAFSVSAGAGTFTGQVQVGGTLIKHSAAWSAAQAFKVGIVPAGAFSSGVDSSGALSPAISSSGATGYAPVEHLLVGERLSAVRVTLARLSGAGSVSVDLIHVNLDLFNPGTSVLTAPVTSTGGAPVTLTPSGPVSIFPGSVFYVLVTVPSGSIFSFYSLNASTIA